MEWLEPWNSTEAHDARFHESFREQLEREVPAGHVMYRLPARIIARGNGDDALFEILDGSGRVAEVCRDTLGAQPADTNTNWRNVMEEPRWS
jgi:hypothetical protein